MKMTAERRFMALDCGGIEIETRKDAAPLIKGYAAVFYDGTPGTEFRLWKGMVERVLPGAFDKALKEDDVRALFNHNPDAVLGRTEAKPPTLRLSVDKRGLRYEIDVPDTQVARDLVVAIKRGDITGSSFGFSVRAEEFERPGENDPDKPVVRKIKDVQLFDVSPVTFPAYKATEVVAREALEARMAAPGTPARPPPPPDTSGRLAVLKREEGRRRSGAAT